MHETSPHEFRIIRVRSVDDRLRSGLNCLLETLNESKTEHHFVQYILMEKRRRAKLMSARN